MSALALSRADDPLEADVSLARAGDRRAFERIYRACVGRVYATCLRMTGDPAAADEATQQAFVNAWQALASFRGEGSFSTWIHRIAVYAVLGDRRRQARGPVAVGAADDAGKTPTPPGARIDLERALAELPDGAREVFVLHDVEGWSHEQIAAAMRVTVGTSKSQLHRARSLLRRGLS